MPLKCMKAVLHGMEQRHSYVDWLAGFSHSCDYFPLPGDLLLDCNDVLFGLREVLATERPQGTRLHIAMSQAHRSPAQIFLRDGSRNVPRMNLHGALLPRSRRQFLANAAIAASRVGS
jgi:hypothetical protein